VNIGDNDPGIGQYFRPDAPRAVVPVQRDGKTILRKAWQLAPAVTARGAGMRYHRRSKPSGRFHAIRSQSGMAA
jgi:hypothetical protein